MKPRMVSLFERTCRIVAGSRSVPSPGGTPLYCAMSPETGTRKIVEQRQHGFPDGSADVLEVNVDAVCTCRGQSRRKIGGAMIDRGVEAKLVLHEGAFLGTASNADRPRPGERRELAD